jgi:hypothetical protein
MQRDGIAQRRPTRACCRRRSGVGKILAFLKAGIGSTVIPI